MSRIAVVSAAASGIGAAVVGQLVADGWRVLGVDLDQERLRLSTAEWTIVGDVLDEATWAEARRVIGSLGDIERLGLVAGVGSAMFRPSREMSDQDWRSMFDVNFMSAVKPVRALLPNLEDAAAASIVVIGSLSGRRMEPTTPAYCAMKAAVEAWSAVLALELAETNIRVNCVIPGVTDTEGLRNNLARKGQTLDDLADRASRQPRGSLLAADEVASVVGFLLSGRASGLLGSSILVDGGLSRRLPG